MMTAPVVSLSELEGTPDDILTVHRVLASAPSYSIAISGGLPSTDDAAAVFASCPPALSRQNKHVYGIYTGTELVGLADVLRSYPSSEIAYIGLLLISETYQHRGLGLSSFERILELVSEWGCDRVRLSVVETNALAAGFWLRVGFTDTGVRVPFSYGTVSSHSMIFEMALPRLPATQSPQNHP